MQESHQEEHSTQWQYQEQTVTKLFDTISSRWIKTLAHYRKSLVITDCRLKDIEMYIHGGTPVLYNLNKTALEPNEVQLGYMEFSPSGSRVRNVEFSAS